MTKEKITPQNVTFKKLDYGFGHDCGGVSGTMYFGKTKVVEFYGDGWSGEIDDLTFFDKKLEQDILDYQKANQPLEYLQSADMFIDTAMKHYLMVEDIKASVKKSITKFKKEYAIEKKETIGAFLFMEEETYTTRMFNRVPVVVSESKMEDYKKVARMEDKYAESVEVYFLSFVSARKVQFKKIK